MLKPEEEEESFSLTETLEMHRDFNHQGEEGPFDTPTGKAMGFLGDQTPVCF